MDRVLIFDTTLRDGEQSPGATLNEEEKVDIAKQLARLGVDIIEAGFPISSEGDFQAVRRVALEVEGPIIAGLARARVEDIDRAWEAVKFAEKPRIHTFIATSDIHLEHKLRKTREEVLQIAQDMVSHAKGYTDDVEFSPEDAGRSDPVYLYEVLEAVIDAGATTVNIPDTVGYRAPSEFGDLIQGIRENVPNIDKAVISVHCHNDLGLATANSLEAMLRGARQVECTINGLGERAGNTSLEEVVMAIHTRPQFFNVTTGVDTTQIYPASRMVSNYTGIAVQPNKAIVGANAFAHEAGIHQDGVLKHSLTYEIMGPETIGLTASNLVLGKHSGRHAFRVKLGELGYGGLSPEDMNRVFERFKELSDKKKVVSDRDIETIIADEIYTPDEVYSLERVQVSCGDHSVPTATVRLRDPLGQVLSDAAIGAGPVDAVCKAINRIVDVPNDLIEFSVRAVTEGIDAQGKVTIRIQTPEGMGTDAGFEAEGGRRIFSGSAADTDIIVASAKAYMNALNKLLTYQRDRTSPSSKKGA